MNSKNQQIKLIPFESNQLELTRGKKYYLYLSLCSGNINKSIINKSNEKITKKENNEPIKFDMSLHLSKS